MSLTEEEQQELERLTIAFDEFQGRGVDLAERIDYLTAKADWDGAMACPQCGSTELATIEQLEGTAACTISESGDIDWEGRTDVNWDSSTTIGVECRGCGWEDQGESLTANLKRSYEVTWSDQS